MDQARRRQLLAHTGLGQVALTAPALVVFAGEPAPAGYYWRHDPRSGKPVLVHYQGGGAQLGTENYHDRLSPPEDTRTDWRQVPGNEAKDMAARKFVGTWPGDPPLPSEHHHFSSGVFEDHEALRQRLAQAAAATQVDLHDAHPELAPGVLRKQFFAVAQGLPSQLEAFKQHLRDVLGLRPRRWDNVNGRPQPGSYY